MTEENITASDDQVREPAQQGVGTLEEALVKEKEKAERYLSNWQRTEADFRNYKAREEQEKREIISLANSVLVCDVLPVLDAFDRAFRGNAPMKDKDSWITGFKQIHKMLVDILNKHGLAETKCVGEIFNPSLHEAVSQRNGVEGLILDEIRKGYKLKDKLIRAPQVVVGKGEVPAGGEAAEPSGGDLPQE